MFIILMYVYVCSVCVCIYVCVCICVCVYIYLSNLQLFGKHCTHWFLKSIFKICFQRKICLSTQLLFSQSVVSNSWDPMNCSTPGFPVHHQLPEVAQTHGHRVSDTIQPSHPHLFSSHLQSFYHQGLF